MLFMIRSFKNPGTEDVFNGKDTRASRTVCPQSLWRIAVLKLDQLDSAECHWRICVYRPGTDWNA